MSHDTPEPPDIEVLLDKLDSIDLDELDVPTQLIALRKGQDWNFFVIPITVLLLLAGLSIGLILEHMILGFAGGALLAFFVGYAYHLYDLQWQRAARQRVVDTINAIEGEAGFLPWFRKILAKSTYRVMFYKLTKLNQIEIEDYVRALRRLKDKDRALLRARLLELYPPPPPPEEETHEQDPLADEDLPAASH